MKRWLVSVFVLVVLLVPAFSYGAGFVPCGGPGEQPCQTCHVIDLVNNVLSWLVVILGTFAAIMIVYAGFKLVTSGGNQAAMQSAKDIMSNIIIGYIIVLAGWLMIDFGMKVLLNEGTFGVWNEVQCVAQPIPNYRDVDRANISVGLIDGGTVGTDCAALPNGTYNCSQQVADCEGGNGVATINTASIPHSVQCTYTSAAYAGSCEVLSSGPCSVAALQPIFGADAEEASRICNKESGGAPVLSGSDLCCGPGDANCSGAPSFSGGYFQVNILAHADMIPGCTPGAFFTPNGNDTLQGDCVRRNSEGICTGWSCTITDQAMYNRCIQGALNSSINLSITEQLYNSRGWNPWLNSANRCSIPI
jgi:hypothetical protein